LKATSVYPELADYDQIGTRIEKLRGKTDLLNQAREAFENQRWDEAHKAYTEVLDEEAGNQEAAERLPKIESQLLLAQAHRHLKNNKFSHAVRTLNASVKRDPDNREASELLQKNQSYRAFVIKGNAAYREQRCEDAEALFRKARATYAERFAAEGLARRLGQGCEQPIPLPLEDIRIGLLALLNSEPQEAISVLEDVVEQVGEDEVRIRAYLGAAYALASVIEQQADRLLLERAKEQFRIVLNSNPEFRLSERLFSPRILGVFEEVSREGPEMPSGESDESTDH
jgi:outer membrane murein-binding lipoprotein Lpp